MKNLLSIAACGAILALSACSSMPAMPTMPELSMPALPSFGAPASAKEKSDAAMADSATPGDLLRRAIDRLGSGQLDDAKRDLQAVLKQSPKNATAASLLKQIETDPAALLGKPGETYVVVAGDTMSELAGRFLGDPMLFYALSRYNGLAAPNTLSEGRVLNLPAMAQKALALDAPKAVPASTQAIVAHAVADTARADATRMKALESLNEGDVDLAVSLLKEAQAINTGDAAIGRDLERALRIQSALKDG